MHKELTPYKTSFARNNFVRRKLFDAYNAVGSVLTAAQPPGAPAYQTPQPTFVKQEVAPQQTAPVSVSDSSEKVTALRSKNVSMFNS
ncbi:hypothetical protein [Polaromonas sp. UBA4122]|uniref:hypothetical protein n=1 Tax=Polaromonas sp. UBA4122 TaxID=1947074 RepID=UPI0025E45312|nr:hypothetical protein [Polaromonas sp. UBA4122]